MLRGSCEHRAPLAAQFGAQLFDLVRGQQLAQPASQPLNFVWIGALPLEDVGDLSRLGQAAPHAYSAIAPVVSPLAVASIRPLLPTRCVRDQVRNLATLVPLALTRLAQRVAYKNFRIQSGVL